MAHLKQRGKTWFAVWTQDGKRVVKSTGVKVEGELTKAKQKQLAYATAQSMEAAAKGALTMDAALQAVRTASVSLGLGTNMPTVKGYLSEYEPTGQAQNVSNARRAIVRFLDFARDHHSTKLDALPVSVCREWLLAESRRVSEGTVGNYKKALNAAYQKAVRDEVLSRNPFSLLRMSDVIDKAVAVRSVKRQPFSLEEMQLLFRELPYPWREMVLISFFTGGQRIGDVATLRWDSIDLEKRLIRLRTQKTGHALEVPIVPALEACLRAQMKGALSDEVYVLPSMAERYRRQASTVSSEFTGLLRGLGVIAPLSATTKKRGDERKVVANKSFHSIRHTVVSMLRASNLVSPDLARAIVGHDSEEVERAYFTASHDDKLAGLELLQSAIEQPS